jgi:hypothetical protein
LVRPRTDFTSSPSSLLRSDGYRPHDRRFEAGRVDRKNPTVKPLADPFGGVSHQEAGNASSRNRAHHHYVDPLRLHELRDDFLGLVPAL